VDIDSQLIVRLLLTKDVKLYESNITKLGNELWTNFFRIDHSLFCKKGYEFNHRISTDGIGCSIHFLRNDLYAMNRKDRPRQQKKPKMFRMERYINTITETERDDIFNRLKKNGKIDLHSLVGIDPGKKELIFCTNGDTKILEKEKTGKMYRKTTTFTYTNGRRKEETKAPLFARKLEKEKMDQKIRNKSIKEIEQTLSEFNSNSCIWANALAHIKQKNSVDRKLQKYYELEKHRARK